MGGYTKSGSSVKKIDINIVGAGHASLDGHCGHLETEGTASMHKTRLEFKVGPDRLLRMELASLMLYSCM